VRRASDVLETYSPLLDRDLEDVALVDLGDVPLPATAAGDGRPAGAAAGAGVDQRAMTAALGMIADAAEHGARMAGLAVMVGGEHTASLGGYRGVQRVHPELALLHVDAHLDIRPEYDGAPLTHASWVYHLGRQLGFDRVFQLGLRSGERDEWRFSRRHAGLCATGLVLPDAARRQLARRPVYLSIDIDVLDPAHAPGTGCPEPGGATFRELLDFLYSLRGLRLVGLDVMEVSPDLDPAEITAVAAAKLVREAVLLTARSA
jgi:agmatinase